MSPQRKLLPSRSHFPFLGLSVSVYRYRSTSTQAMPPMRTGTIQTIRKALILFQQAAPGGSPDRVHLGNNNLTDPKRFQQHPSNGADERNNPRRRFPREMIPLQKRKESDSVLNNVGKRIRWNYRVATHLKGRDLGVAAVGGEGKGW